MGGVRGQLPGREGGKPGSTSILYPAEAWLVSYCGCQVVYSSEFRKMQSLWRRTALEREFEQFLSCGDNPCGDPRLALPHSHTWQPAAAPPVCHAVTSRLQGDCEVVLNVKQEINQHRRQTFCKMGNL